MTVKIYKVDKVVQAHAKLQSREFVDVKKRHAQIVKSVRFQKAFPNYPKYVGIGKGSGRGSYAKYTYPIQISLGGNCSEEVLLHEMAHVIQFTHGTYRSGKRGGHGADFAKAMLDLVSIVLGKSAADELKSAYAILGIKIYQNGKETKVRKTAKATAVAEKYGLTQIKRKNLVAEVDGLERIEARWWKYQGVSIRQRGRSFYVTVGGGYASLTNLEDAITYIQANQDGRVA